MTPQMRRSALRRCTASPTPCPCTICLPGPLPSTVCCSRSGPGPPSSGAPACTAAVGVAAAGAAAGAPRVAPWSPSVAALTCCGRPPRTAAWPPSCTSTSAVPALPPPLTLLCCWPMAAMCTSWLRRPKASGTSPESLTRLKWVQNLRLSEKFCCGKLPLERSRRPQDSAGQSLTQLTAHCPQLWTSVPLCWPLTEFPAGTVEMKSKEEETAVDKGDLVALSLPAGHGDTDGPISLDVPDGAPDPQRTKAAIDHLHQKILKITEQIKIEQEARDDNVAEYLKLANNADKQQVSRIKQVFEKKNQKSAQTIAQLHKKLEHYRRRLKEIEQNGPSRQPKDVLRDMQQGLKDVGANVRAGISGFGGGVVEGVKGSLSGLSQATHTAVVSKPREFASLIRNKFGSADNIAHLKDPLEDGPSEEAARALSGSATLVSSPKYGSDDECSSASASSAGAGSNSGAGPSGALGSPKSSALYGAPGNLDALLEELREIKEGQSHLEDSMEDLKTQLQRDYTYMTQCLQEERYRYERLEEQLNDLTELHQNEMTNLKQELASMEEKVAYQSYERARDIQEAVESCLTRVTKLELQQQQQQVVQLEGVENANARALLGKFINVILALMAVLLVFVSTVANFITPLMKTRLRITSTALLVLVLFLLWKHWDSLTYLLEHVLLPS
ncbi:PREDICTED: transmembrane and coiled-coil domains protein 2 isoform X2 [Rhinopithecus bieti]|nr:PREDICTED: transmembrane and coiled-coil domains protein 2 isoform X2 [Rhinopithecus bieti]XP_017736469.1 PREDICTED: transmembrane and coiled-coil domains protein 2 isoform X2 [Rhinopithecus bieti]